MITEIFVFQLFLGNSLTVLAKILNEAFLDVVLASVEILSHSIKMFRRNYQKTKTHG